MMDVEIHDDALLKRMSNYEHKVEELTHEIIVQLGENCMTPFEREEINVLTSVLDDIADYIYASAKYIYLYKSPQTAAYSEFSLLIYKACLEVQKAVVNLDGFKNPAVVKEACIKINSIENIADDVLSQAIVKLFETNDPINIIKVKSFLDYLEIVTDKAEDVANTIDNILIKYA